MQPSHGSQSTLRAEAPVFMPGSTNGGGGGGGGGGGSSHASSSSNASSSAPLRRRNSMSAHGGRGNASFTGASGKRASGGLPRGTSFQARSGAPLRESAQSQAPTFSGFHSKMTAQEAYKLRQAKASKAFVAKRRAAAEAAAAAQSSEDTAVGEASGDAPAGQPDGEGGGGGQGKNGTPRSRANKQRKSPRQQSTKKRTSDPDFAALARRRSSEAKAEREQQRPASPTQGAEDAAVVDAAASPQEEVQAHSSPASGGSQKRDVVELSPVLSNVSGASAMIESPERDSAESGTRRRLESDSSGSGGDETLSGSGSAVEKDAGDAVRLEKSRVLSAAAEDDLIVEGATEVEERPHEKGVEKTAPCEMDESGMCVHAKAAAAANAAAKAAAEAAAAAAAATAPQVSDSKPTLDSGKWCQDCAGLGLHLSALVQALKAGKTQVESAADLAKEKEAEAEKKSSWKRTVSAAMLGSTGSSSSSNTELQKLKADRARLDEENEVLRAAVEFLYKKIDTLAPGENPMLR